MNFLTKTAHRLMLVAAGILILGGIPQPQIDITNTEGAFSVDLTVLESSLYGDIRAKHACGDEPKTENTDKHAFTHCGWWQWIALGVALAAVAATAAALIAGAAASGQFLGLAALAWRWIACSGVGLAIIMQIVYATCNPNAGGICNEPRT